MLCALPYPYLGTPWTLQAFTHCVHRANGPCSHSPAVPQKWARGGRCPCCHQTWPCKCPGAAPGITFSAIHLPSVTPQKPLLPQSQLGQWAKWNRALSNTESEIDHPSVLSAPRRIMVSNQICGCTLQISGPSNTKQNKKILLVHWLLQMLLIRYLHPCSQLCF